MLTHVLLSSDSDAIKAVRLNLQLFFRLTGGNLDELRAEIKRQRRRRRLGGADGTD
jgi:hypothetical protein